MEIDHIFIFSNNKGKEAEDLVNFGFTEGSNRIHPGQGTRNRKFYFDNFYLEILWVIDEKEIQSEITSVTKLWERSQFQQSRYSPFGLGLENINSTNQLFEKSKIYKPIYLPKDKWIDIITNEDFPDLPWIFRFPFSGKKSVNNEPIEHFNGIKSLTRTEFEICSEMSDITFLDYFNGIDHIAFKVGERTHLTLEFDNKVQGKKKEFPELNLTLKF